MKDAAHGALVHDVRALRHARHVHGTRDSSLRVAYPPQRNSHQGAVTPTSHVTGASLIRVQLCHLVAHAALDDEH